MTDDELTKLIKWQIDGMHSWNIDNVSLNGTDDYQYTYSYQKQLLYVMMPDKESVNNAKEKINSIM